MMECEMIADRLRAQGWTLNWFRFVDRDGHIQWRLHATKEGRMSFTIQADDLRAALLGLENRCREAWPDRVERT